jgi:hypothetical protein
MENEISKEEKNSAEENYTDKENKINEARRSACFQ